MWNKGSYVKRDEEMEQEFEKSQAEHGTTITQWTNAAYRIGETDGINVGIIVGSAITVVGAAVGFGLALLVDRSVCKIRTLVAERKARKKATT